VGRDSDRARAPGAQGLGLKRPSLIVHQREPFNAEPPREALDEAQLTPLDAFYVRSHGPVPDANDARMRLRVEGLVERELELTMDDLRGGHFADRELVATLQCAGNRRAGLMEVREIPGEAPWGPAATGTASWRGVALRDVLEEAGVREGASHVGFAGADPSDEVDPPQLYGGSVPLLKAMAEEVLLAWEMNGEPLQPYHGAPLRVVVPGYIGARSVKWLRRVVVRAEPWDGHFQSTAYRLLPPDAEPAPGVGVPLGELPLSSDVLAPDDGARLDAGEVEVRGYALAGGNRHVTRVDVSIDGGATFRQAELLEDIGRWAWRLWRARVELEPGSHEIVVRAWDSAGSTQPEDPAAVWNPKGYVNSSWARVSVVASAA
jgi:sulfite oxidase